MIKLNTVAKLLLLSMSLAVVTNVSAANIEQRLQRIEKLMSNQVLMEQMQQMQQVRQELTELRGLVENQEHQINMIKQRQRNLYQDMDRRLLELESSKSSGMLNGVNSAVPVSSIDTVLSSGIAVPGSSPIASPIASPVNTLGAIPTSAADVDGKQAYAKAFGLLKEGRYQQAIIDFRNFLQYFPQSKYSANALYWLGEANYVSRDYKTALSEFKKIITLYPQSNKVQGAELKIGYTFYEMKNWASAKTALSQVISRYPNSTVARKAKERLQRIKREGH